MSHVACCMWHVMADSHHHSMLEGALRCAFLAALLGCQTHVASGFSVGGPWGFTKTGTTRTQQQRDDDAATFNRRSHHHQSFTYRPRKVCWALSSTAASSSAAAAAVLSDVYRVNKPCGTNVLVCICLDVPTTTP